MFGFLLCVISFTRTTIVYLSSTLFGKSDQRLQYSRATNENSTLGSEMGDQTQENNKSQKLDVMDGVPTLSGSYSDDFIPQPTIYVKSAVGKDDMFYNMNHKRRGKCVIFNNDKFEMGGIDREGSEIDVAAITRVFHDILGFDVISHTNLTSYKIHETVKKLSKDNYEEEDCLCVFILTHGSYNDTLFAHDCTYSLKTVWQKFTGDNCHSLVGKPKLFFIQACRGEKYDAGIGVRSSGNSQTDSVSTVSYKIPTHADILLAHSTVDGFYSWRNPTEGTYYVQTLCEMIEEYWKTHDLASILTITARVVANEYSSVHDDSRKNQLKQMPSITSTLTRYVHFTKKNL